MAIKIFVLCNGKVFIHVNPWIIGKNVMKNHYLKKNKFYSKPNVDINELD